MYTDIVYETENAIFKFLLLDVKDLLNYYAYEHGVEKAKDLISFLKTSSDSQIVIPEKCHYFCFIVVDLIGKGKGSIICKPCHKIYGSFDLKKLPLGHGKSPSDIRILIEKGFLKSYSNRQCLL